MKSHTKLWGMATMAFCLALIGCGTVSPSPSKSKPQQTLSVLYAGSMTSNMEHQIEPDFTQDTGIQVQGQGAGSSQLAQEMESGLRQPDVFISASPSVNDKLLMGDANQNIVKWYLTFARDQLVIAYNPNSKFAQDLKAANQGTKPWYSVLENNGFLLGRTDPSLDPKGASTVLMFKLAEKYYHQTGLATTIMGDIENPSQVYPEEALLARLTSGQLDAVIAYKHEAVDWNLPYVTLPKEINLSDPSLAKLYASVSMKTKDGKTVKGAPVVFTVTIPNTVQNEAAAEQFVRYVVAGKGHALLMKDGFTPMDITVGGAKNAIPSALQDLVSTK